MSEKSRRRVAFWLATVTFVAVLGFSLVILLVPVGRHWDVVWKDDPFSSRETVTTVTKVTGGFKGNMPASTVTKGGGTAPKTVISRKGRSTERTITRTPADESFAERTLGEAGLLVGRLALAVLAAFLAAAIVQRVVLGHYAVKIGTLELGDLPAIADDVKKGLEAVASLTNELKDKLEKEIVLGQETSDSLKGVAMSTATEIAALDKRVAELAARIPPA